MSEVEIITKSTPVTMCVDVLMRQSYGIALRVIRAAASRVRRGDADLAPGQRVGQASLRSRRGRAAWARGRSGGRGARDTGGTRAPDPHRRRLAGVSDVLGDRPDADALRNAAVAGAQKRVRPDRDHPW